ncbi:DUF2199 domain-containing protein [Flavitalea sp. BT771]|uniref:DUF2199 domain-containing protein n=1 Tax=Flavitalea sp. BT771 TaxID=3063329 RepID=UPI0026E33DBD|nr:DUF2199 domain-containing protein [Flavitalea sp. BT771]MDO6432111.1 DUF2199 domain-containing protein [Flavitalea sp. BT771]MDV6221020.1 DUF2199 domain-containing protein [Flavitalea sp. BT771]
MKLFQFFNPKRNKFSYKCPCCGQVYDEMPLCFGGEYPDYYFSVPPEERATRIELTESLCVVDEEHFFHRGRITIPIHDHSEDLIFNVWTSISKENFAIRNSMWNDPERVHNKPYFGWLQTLVPTYGNTLNLKTQAREQEIGLIPSIEIIEENHPLTLDQRNGISLVTATKKVEAILREYHNPDN